MVAGRASSQARRKRLFLGVRPESTPTSTPAPVSAPAPALVSAPATPAGPPVATPATPAAFTPRPGLGPTVRVLPGLLSGGAMELLLAVLLPVLDILVGDPVCPPAEAPTPTPPTRPPPSALMSCSSCSCSCSSCSCWCFFCSCGLSPASSSCRKGGFHNTKSLSPCGAPSSSAPITSNSASALPLPLHAASMASRGTSLRMCSAGFAIVAEQQTN
mmetsp:Transcript_16644/g.36922  ORF Transcript_16644/g.36922 Transcript_16644/m.36922 type:complete len:216 (-) Transcript_16644:1482-2129(-)